MTALAVKKSADVYVGDDLSAAGYSDKEISLIGYCWKDAEAINKDKTSLAMHLWELKQEMDTNGSKAAGGEGGGSTKSRFWAAFEAGHLPYAGDKGKVSVHTCLRAASFLEDIASDRSFKYLNDRLRNLAPATLYEISNLEDEAQQLVYKSIESSDFIGVAAVRLIAHEAEQEVFNKLFAWVEEHPTKVITPKTIRALQAEVTKENTPADEQIVDVKTPEQKAADEANFQKIMADVKASAPERARNARVNAVKEELARPERERQQRLEDHVRQYNSKLISAYDAVHNLLIFLRGIDRIDGTQYLHDMRETDVMGLITVRDDLPRIKGLGEELMEIAQLANSCNPPTGIDMTTFTVEADEA